MRKINSVLGYIYLKSPVLYSPNIYWIQFQWPNILKLVFAKYVYKPINMGDISIWFVKNKT